MATPCRAGNGGVELPGGQLWVFGQQTGASLGWPGMSFAILSLGAWRHGGTALRSWRLGLLAFLAAAGPLLVEALNPSPDHASQDLIPPYFDVAHLPLTLLGRSGLAWLAHRFVFSHKQTGATLQVKG